MHVTLCYSESQLDGHGYLAYLLSCSCIISPDLGLPTQVQRAEYLKITELFNLERATFFSQSFSGIDTENNC